MMALPLIYLKAALQSLVTIFFAAAFGIFLDLAIYFYLKGGFDADNFRDSQYQRYVFIGVSVSYAVLTICSCVASLFTVHLLSDNFKADDYCFEQLWKLLGLDKKKTPLPSPFDEEPNQDENAYLQPIVHFDGPGISIKDNMTSPEKVICEETIISKIPSNVNMEDIVLQKDPLKIEK